MKRRILKKNILKHEGLKEWFPKAADRLEGLASYTLETTEAALRAVAEEEGIKPGIIINGISHVFVF